MRNSVLLILLCLLLSEVTVAQEVKPRKITAESIALTIGGTRANSKDVSPRVFQKMTPDATLPFANLSNFNNNLNSYRIQDMVGIKVTFGDQNWRESGKKWRTTYRIGLSRFGFSPIETGFYKDTTAEFDRYVSPNTGGTIYIDSTFHDRYSYQYFSRVYMLDFGFQLSSNTDKRWAVYAGLIGNVGATVGSAHYVHSTSTTYENSDGSVNNGTNTNNDGYDGESEYYNTGTGFAFGIAVPMGVQFRIAKTHQFLNRIRLQLEWKPGVVAQTIPTYGLTANMVKSTSFGIQVDI